MAKRKSKAMGASMSVPTPRPVGRGRAVPKAAASNLPNTMKNPFMKGGGKAVPTRRKKSAA
jgi:hypothetical protein